MIYLLGGSPPPYEENIYSQPEDCHTQNQDENNLYSEPKITQEEFQNKRFWFCAQIIFRVFFVFT